MMFFAPWRYPAATTSSYSEYSSFWLKNRPQLKDEPLISKCQNYEGEILQPRGGRSNCP